MRCRSSNPPTSKGRGFVVKEKGVWGRGAGWQGLGRKAPAGRSRKAIEALVVRLLLGSLMCGAQAPMLRNVADSLYGDLNVLIFKISSIVLSAALLAMCQCAPGFCSYRAGSLNKSCRCVVDHSRGSCSRFCHVAISDRTWMNCAP